MVDRYCRKFKSITDDIENSLQMFGILSKLKEYDGKLTGIDTNESAISSNKTKIETIKNNMSMKIRKDIYEKMFIISNMTTKYTNKKLLIYINSNFTTHGIIKINANYNYFYYGNNFSHI